MQARVISSAFSTNPLEARAVVEYVPETQAEHDQLAALFGEKLAVVSVNRTTGNVLRAEFDLFPAPKAPSSADLDADAEEKKAAEATEVPDAT